jgi:hypothetical protein
MITDAFIVLQKHFPFSCEEFLSCQRQIFLFFWMILHGGGEAEQHNDMP